MKIWDAVHDEWDRLRSQNQRRKFCKANFLSYQRMREWQDLYAQLHGALEELGRFKLNESSADYAAIHRSILTGLLAHVATRKERNQYQGIGNRQLALFPGSALFDRNEKPPKPTPRPRPQAANRRAETAVPPQPPWIVAGEIVETSQLFARTVAGIDPLWIVQLAPHLCQVTHQNPQWSVTAGNVLVDEKNHALRPGSPQGEGRARQHQSAGSHGNFHPLRARRGDLAADARREPADEENDDDDTRIFIQRDQPPPLPPQYAFLEHNRQVRQKIETWQTRVRRHDFGDLDEKLFAVLRAADCETSLGSRVEPAASRLRRTGRFSAPRKRT